jgi:hypothetical protein
MTEILGNDDEWSEAGSRRRDRRPPDWAVDPTPVELIGGSVGPAEAEDPEYDSDAAPAGRWRLLLADLTQPATFAVASALSLVVAAAVGPSYRFDAYPFSQGVSSLGSALGGALLVHPLHDYLTASAPAIVLVLAALGMSLSAALRSRTSTAGTASAAWVRPVAAGALIVAVLMAVLLGLGAYRTSTYELTVPPQTGAASS